MGERTRILTISVAALLCMTLITVASTIYFYQDSVAIKNRYVELQQQLFATQDELQSLQQNYTVIREAVLYVNMTIDYGNGTVELHDNIYIAPTQTVFDALKTVADVNATYWDVFQAWFINAINSVANNENGNNRWWVYAVNGEHAAVGADAYELLDGDYVEWTYYQY